MEQRDYLLRQIELMTQAIVALIRRLTGFKEDRSSSEEDIEQVTNEMLSGQMEMDLSDILEIPLEEISDRIINIKGIHLSNIELFAEVIYLNAKACLQTEKKVRLLMIALELYEYADRESGTFSIERHAKINDINSQLAQNE